MGVRDRFRGLDDSGVEQEGLIGGGAGLSSGEQRYARRGGRCEERADVKIENDDVKEHKSEEIQVA
jgi:hypothetical protein